ncbi:MAG: hypothetical protein JWN57_911 [Frankiales bacterium]|jgi:hypothetical protein|nr:hypothetical protein [Frankiales bacterium]
MTATDLLFTVLRLGLIGLVVFALVDAVRAPAEAFLAAGKQSKPIWLGILGVCALLTIVLGVSVIGILGAVVAVAAIVYLVDVRPAVRGLRPGGPWG